MTGVLCTVYGAQVYLKQFGHEEMHKKICTVKTKVVCIKVLSPVPLLSKELKSTAIHYFWWNDFISMGSVDLKQRWMQGKRKSQKINSGQYKNLNVGRLMPYH